MSSRTFQEKDWFDEKEDMRKLGSIWKHDVRIYGKNKSGIFCGKLFLNMVFSPYLYINVISSCHKRDFKGTASRWSLNFQ